MITLRNIHFYLFNTWQTVVISHLLPFAIIVATYHVIINEPA